MLRLVREVDESICVLLVALAPLQKQNELQESLLVHMVAVGDQVLHRRSHQCGQLVLNADKRQQFKELGIDLVSVLVLEHVLNQLF